MRIVRPRSLEGGDAKGLITVDGEFPIDLQFLAVELDPRLDQLHRSWRQLPVQTLAVVDRQHGLFALVTDVDVRAMMLPVVAVEHQDDDAVEGADRGHAARLARSRLDTEQGQRTHDGVVTWPGEIDLAPDAMYAAIAATGEWRSSGSRREPPFELFAGEGALAGAPDA